MVSLGFSKGIDGSWYVITNGSMEERRMILGANTLLDLTAGNSAYQSFDFLGIEKDDLYTQREGKNVGYSALFKQQDSPDGGATYACPSYKGEPINHYLWLGNVVGKAFNGFPDVILFKKR
jgi:hypothetical protein